MNEQKPKRKGLGRPKKNLSKAAIRKALRLYAMGVPLNRIAADNGMSYHTLRRNLREENLAR